MGFGGVRLLERLRCMEGFASPGVGEDSGETESIRSHIHSLLCTKRGTCLIADEYGMPDVFFSHGINFQESTGRMLAAIRSVVTGFEPRLTAIRVNLISGKDEFLQQRFELWSTLTRDPSIQMSFLITITSEARITVTRKD